MKVAEVRYVGRLRRKRERAPSDEEYVFHRSTQGSVPVSVDSLEDADFFAEKELFEVEWTSLGEVTRVTDGPMDSIEAMLGDMVYQQKQKLASKLGTKASGKEEEIDEALEEAIKDLQHDMENQ